MATKTDLNQTLTDVEDSKSFIGASRGATPLEVHASNSTDNSVGTLVGVVGDLFSLGVKAADTSIKSDIDKEALKETDQVFDEFGVGDVGTLNKSVNQEPLPRDIERSMKNIERLTASKDQGETSTTAYWGRMYNIARQLRARYPGHREYIDDRIAEISGGRPANRIVAELQQEAAQASADARTEENQLFQLQWQLNKEGLWNDSYKGLNRQQLLDATSAQFQRRERLKWQKENIELAKARNENVDRLVASSADEAAHAYQVKVFSDATIGAGQDAQNFQAALERFRNNPNPSPDEIEALRRSFSLMKQSYTQGLTQMLLDNYGSDIKKKDFDDIIGKHTMVINQFEDALVNKDVGLLQTLTHKLEALKSGDDYKFLNFHPTFRAAAAARRNLGDTASTTIVANSDRLQAVHDKALLSDNLYQAFGGEITALDALDNKNKALNPGAYARGVVNAHVDMIKSNKTTPEQKAHAINSLFQPDLLKHFTEGEGRDVAYTSMVNSQIFEEIKKLKSSDPATFNRYTRWAETTYLTENKQDADTLKQAVANKRDIFDVTLNPNTQEIEVKLTDKTLNRMKVVNPRTGVSEIPDYAFNNLPADFTLALRAAERLNRNMRGLNPIIEDKGMTPSEYWDLSYGLGRILDTNNVEQANKDQ